MKILIVVCHPDSEKSVINASLIKEVVKYPELFTVHCLYEEYPNGIIDVEKEQKLLEGFDSIVLQYPLYWFNCPPLLKQWIDEVFLYGWGYGSKSNGLRSKKIALVISAGIKESDFSKEGKMKVTIDELISPFRATFLYTKSNFVGYHVIYDTHNIKNNEALEKMALECLSFLKQI